MVNYSAWGAIPRALKEGMNAFQEAKRATREEEMLAQKLKQDEARQRLLDSRYDNEQATKASQFAQEMEMKNRMLAGSAGEKAQDRKAKEATLAQGKRPGETTVRMLSEGQLIPGILGDVGGIIEKSPNLFGPMAGRAGAANPYAVPAQQANAKIEAAAQMVGKYMEGGVLRAEDVVKYKRMLPQLSDKPEVAAAKLKGVKQMLSKKYNQDLQSMTQGGYDVSKFNPMKIEEDASGLDPAIIQQAQEALNDPDAPPEVKAKAQAILQGR